MDIDNNRDSKTYYDSLLKIRTQFRNFVSHGSFGKNNEAFAFHSKTGAIPISLSDTQKNGMLFEREIEEITAIDTIKKFIIFLWTEDRAIAKIYIKSTLPSILTLSSDGTYCKAMKSIKSMNELVDYMILSFDRSANMDF